MKNIKEKDDVAFVEVVTNQKMVPEKKETRIMWLNPDYALEKI